MPFKIQYLSSFLKRYVERLTTRILLCFSGRGGNERCHIRLTKRQYFFYCTFHKHANSKVQKPPSQLRFLLRSIIITITSNEPLLPSFSGFKSQKCLHESSYDWVSGTDNDEQSLKNLSKCLSSLAARSVLPISKRQYASCKRFLVNAELS